MTSRSQLMAGLRKFCAEATIKLKSGGERTIVLALLLVPNGGPTNKQKRRQNSPKLIKELCRRCVVLIAHWSIRVRQHPPSDKARHESACRS